MNRKCCSIYRRTWIGHSSWPVYSTPAAATLGFCVLFTALGLGLPTSVEIQGPVFVQEPPDEVDFANTTGIKIACSVHGNPKPSVSWLLSTGEALTSVVSLREVHSNGTLAFLPFRPEEYRQDIHAAVYRCQASNALGTIISRHVHVRAVVKQYYEVHVYDEFVINGNTAVFQCIIPSFVRDYVTVTSWVRDGPNTPQQVLRSGGRYSVHSSGDLHIRNAQEADGRFSYRCKTEHRLTVESKLSASAGRLIVTDPASSVPPRIAHVKNPITAQEGETVELPCAAQGFPLPTYSWRRSDGHGVKYVQPSGHVQLISGSLQIRNAKIADAGTYQCVVNNTVGEEKLEVELKVTAPLFAYVEPQKQVIDVGKSASFRCSYSGFPISDVRWIKDGRALLNSLRIGYPTRDHLHIQSVEREDRGMYQCFVNSGQRTVQATAELRLGDAKPQLLRVFESQVLRPGTSLSLLCVTSGNPPPQVKWTLDEMPIRSSDRFFLDLQINVHGDVISYVNISDIRPEDGGEYKCVTTNKVGSVEHRQRIDVHGPPFIRPMQNVSAVSGSSWYLRCLVAGYPIRSITWERDGTNLPINHRQKVFPNGTLVVHNAQRATDAGLYSCVARGDEPTRIAQGSVFVTVMNPPKISPFSFPRDIQEGMRASITCSVFHGDLPINVSWLKDGHAIRPTADLSLRRMDDHTTTLVVQRITPKDNGNYTCVAQNAAAAVNYTAQLLVLVPPRWIFEPKDSSVISGKSIIIDCQADGLPRPYITWKKAIGRLPGDYVPIDYSSGRNYMYPNGSLLLTSIQVTDSGYYLCQSNNSVGAGLSKVISLKVHAPAYFEEKFRNQTVRKGHDAVLSCESQGDSPLKIEWKVHNQKIDTRKKSKYATREQVTAAGFISQLIVSRTSRDDTAEFSCLAINDYGKDQAWISLIVQEPPEAPRDVKVSPQTSRMLGITWTPAFDGNNRILHYIIQVKAVSTIWILDRRNVSVNGDETTAVVVDLHPAVEYLINVAAQNSVGVGAFSTAVQLMMAEEAPEGPPLNITAEATGSQSLRISWKPPKHETRNGEILGYFIEYREYDSAELLSIKTTDIKSEHPGQFQLEGLTKFTKYAITVQAFNNIGMGPKSREIIARTMEDVPSQPPRNIKCGPMAAQSLHLSWNSPPQQSLNGILQGYRVVYKPVEEFNVNSKLEFRTTTSTETKLQGLGKYTNYSIQVQAFTSAGDGAKSSLVYCRTKEDVPGPPADIKVLPMSSDAIIVSWIPPNHPNGIINKYTVYMRVIDDYQKGAFSQFNFSIQLSTLQSANKCHMIGGSYPVSGENSYSALSFTLPPTQFYYEARGLSENLQYEFWVKASTTVGEGEKTRVISNSPVSTVPARIASFPQTVLAKRKDDIKLPCRAVGIPTPDREWLFMGRHIDENGRIQAGSDGTLLITSYRSTDAGNYSCHVHNIYAKEETSHAVINKPHVGNEYPPSPPILKFVSKTTNSITISWKLEDFEDLPITGVALNYKKDVGKWEEIRLSSLSTSYLLEKLACGTVYHLYMIAYNQVGGSEPSDMLTETTSGTPPQIPERDSILDVNSTFVTLLLPLWPDGGCPILHFLVEFKEKDSLDWLIVTNKVSPLEPIMIPNLTPRTHYSVRVNAVNGAGSTPVEFDFMTLKIPTGIANNEEVMEGPQFTSKFYLDLNALVPIISAIVIIVAILIVACIFVRKRRYNGYLYTVRSVRKSELNNPSQPRETAQKNVPTTPTNESQQYDQAYTPNKSNVGANESQNGIRDEISPYATFQLPATRYTDAADVHFHTFGYDASKLADYPSSPQFQYTKVRKKNALHCHPMSNSRAEGIPMNVRSSASKEHLNPLRAATLKKQEDPVSSYPTQDEPIVPSAPPAESDSMATDPDTPDIAPSTKKGMRILNYVPDILDHRPDSSSSNESTPEMDSLPFPRRENKERMARPCRIALRKMHSIERYSNPDGAIEEHSFTFHKPAKSSSDFGDSHDSSSISRNSQDQNPKSPSGLAAVEEELIALLKRGAEQNTLRKDEANNYNNINV